LARGRRGIGDRGEELALQRLLAEGYELVERNYRTRYGEIDLILRHGDCMVFVAVKLRRGSAFGDPAEAVKPRKQRTIRTIAEQYIADREPVFEEARFDVIGLLDPGAEPVVRHIEGAF
jgi:putative endonuclease